MKRNLLIVLTLISVLSLIITACGISSVSATNDLTSSEQQAIDDSMASNELLSTYLDIEHVISVTLATETGTVLAEYTTESNPEKVDAILRYFTEYPRDHTSVNPEYYGCNGVITISGDSDAKSTIILHGSYIHEKAFDASGKASIDSEGNLLDGSLIYHGSDTVGGVAHEVWSLFDYETDDTGWDKPLANNSNQ